MSGLSKIPGDDNLFVGGIWALNLESHKRALYENNITHILSVISFSLLEKWGAEEAGKFQHLSFDVDDDEDADLLGCFPAAVRFIDAGLHPVGGEDAGESNEGDGNDGGKKGGVYVHCAMGKSRSVTCIIAYLLYKYPTRFGGAEDSSSPASRRKTASTAIRAALDLVRVNRPLAEPNEGFMRQLSLWWEMGCPATDERAVENHAIYQKWRYEAMLREARDARMAPDAEAIRFENVDERCEGKKIRCKKCNATLATDEFLVEHDARCAHIFVDTLSWMRPMLEDGALDGRLICPNRKCGATVGRFAWQGLKCTCGRYVVPTFSLNRSRVDEMVVGGGGGGGSRGAGAAAPGIRMPPIRLPPGRTGNL